MKCKECSGDLKMYINGYPIFVVKCNKCDREVVINCKKMLKEKK